MPEENKKDRIREEPVTYDVYADMPEDGNRYEIDDGMLELMSPGPSLPHQSVSGELFLLLSHTCRTDYVIMNAPLDLILSPTDVRQPDLAMVHRSREHILTVRGIEGPPDLVAEILSPGSKRRDRIRKMITYARYGVEEYWIVDPDGESLEQYVLGDGRYDLAEVYERDMPVQSDKLPCVAFTMNELFAGVIRPDRKG